MKIDVRRARVQGCNPCQLWSTKLPLCYSSSNVMTIIKSTYKTMQMYIPLTYTIDDHGSVMMVWHVNVHLRSNQAFVYSLL